MILSTFSAYNRFNQLLEFKLCKVGESCYRVWKTTNSDTTVVSKPLFLREFKLREAADSYFNELKKEYGVYD